MERRSPAPHRAGFSRLGLARQARVKEVFHVKHDERLSFGARDRAPRITWRSADRLRPDRAGRGATGVCKALSRLSRLIGNPFCRGGATTCLFVKSTIYEVGKGPPNPLRLILPLIRRPEIGPNKWYGTFPLLPFNIPLIPLYYSIYYKGLYIKEVINGINGMTVSIG